MLVKYWMRKAVITINVDDSMSDAINRMKEYFVPMLPVLKAGKLVGVVTDRDLKKAAGLLTAPSPDVGELSCLSSSIKIGDIMTGNPVTVRVDSTLTETAALLLKKKISGAPVVDDQGRIWGTIDQRDIFRAIVSLIGFSGDGVETAFRIEDRPGSIKEVTDVIRKFGGRLGSLTTSKERAPAGFRNLYVVIRGLERDALETALDETKKTVTVLYVVDHRHGIREEYVEWKPVPGTQCRT